MKTLLLTLAILGMLVSSGLCKSKTLYQIDGSGKMNVYDIDDRFGERTVYNLRTGEIGWSEKDLKGDTWSVRTGRGKDDTMDALLSSGDEGED